MRGHRPIVQDAWIKAEASSCLKAQASSGKSAAGESLVLKRIPEV